MEQIEKLLKQGIEIRSAIKPVVITADNSFIYDFGDTGAFEAWKRAVLDAVNDKAVADLLYESQRGELLPEKIGKVLTALRIKAGGFDTRVSPLAPRSTDIE